ncbi:fatty acyl-AMP ligase [Leptolyngbya sp. FACHB-261]|uniref:fatty acyl-AMP ligase n=1 Tax=Leptolyngbya sp. FACHB-261 TaxID=2692806 RepID=UPI001683E94D|nr:fatty acyl-AMP ligase [Leptolyngbya sp. FACHB-261]MBD2103372.1 fatty acyl-AMP ligase [Leptolyngbya sp. FACHB-261]
MANCPTDAIGIRPKVSTLVELLADKAQAQPNQLAYIFLQDGETEAGRLTYQELDRQARVIAAKLQSLRLSGSRALLLYPSGLEFIAAFLGCLYAGVVAVPAYPPRRNQSLSRLQAIMADARAAVALTTTPLLGDIEERFAEDPELSPLSWLATDNLDPGLAGTWQQPDIQADTLAFLQYTSGSTGTPKGVMVSHGNLLHNSALIHQSFADTPESQGVSWLPPYHDMGLIGGVLQPLYVGAPMVLMPAVAFMQKPIRWLQAISRYKATTSGGPNFAYDLCLRKITPEQLATLDLSSWEVAFTGAEPVRAETLTQFAETFAACGFRREAFHPCYGMAETTLIVSGGVRTAPTVFQQVDSAALEQNRVVTTAREGEGTRTIVGCGQNLLDQQILIVDPESRLPRADNQVGEIWVSGASVAQGYWQKPELTQQTFQAYLANTVEGETGQIGPFLRTGDLGFLQDGELFITGRIKDLMIIRGQNHYPQDIELTVEKSHPALRVSSGAAFTVEAKGEERLVVVQEVERSYLRKLDVNQVVGNIRQAVAANHALQVYAAVLVKTGSIPKTSSGKIQRHACRSGFLNGTLNVVEDWSENPQTKVKFLHLQAEIESVLQKLSTSK